MAKKHIHADLIIAWAMGDEIEQFHTAHNYWLLDSTPGWWPGTQYRIALTQPSFNFDHVNQVLMFFAKDASGASYVYENKPHKMESNWLNSGGLVYSTDAFPSFDPGTCDWADSLIHRFEGSICVEDTIPKVVHADIFEAWKNGSDIEVYDDFYTNEPKWIDIDPKHCLDIDLKYRVKKK